MKKIFKQTLSLIMAVLMVLALIPAMPLAAKAEDFTPGQSWTIGAGYETLIQGAFTPDGEDFVYEADETLNWKAWIVTAQNVRNLQMIGKLFHNGQQIAEKTQSGINASKGVNLELCSAASFPEVTADMYGNFELTIEVYYSGSVIATGVLNFVRNEPAPVETEPVETEPVETEPVETEPAATEPVEVVPANMAGFRVNDDNTVTWLEATGKKLSKTEVNATAHMYGISKGGYATCAVSEAFLLDFNGKVTVEVEYATAYGTNFTFAYTDTTGARKDAEIAETKAGTKSNTMIAVYNIEDAGFNGTLVSGGEAFGILANDTTGIKAVVITKVVEETPEEPTEPEQPGKVEYKAEWTYKTGYEFINGAFNTAEEDFIFAGTPYDWTVTINSDKSTGARIDATLETQDGQVLTASKEVTIPVGEFQLFDYTAFPELTNELIGNFKLTTTITVKLSGVETAVAQLVAVFGRSAAYVEPQPEEPGKVEYKAEWTYKTGYEFINGAFNTAEEDFIFAGTPYDWTVTINSDQSTGARIDATLETQDGQVLTASKEVTIPVGEFQLFDYTAFPELTNELIGNFKLTTTITVKLNGVETPVAQLVAVFGRSAAYVEPQPEEPGKVEYKAEWTYKSGYEFINGAFNTAEEDFIFAGTPYDWTVTVNSEKSAGVRIDATLETQDGQTLTASKELTIPVGEFQLFDYTAFPQLTNELIGNFRLTTTITAMVNGVETPVAQLVAVFGRSAAYVEPEEPTPEEPAAPTKPGEVVWQYGKTAEGEGYEWLTGAIATGTEGGIYKGWDAYDWAVTLSPTKVAATVTVEAEAKDHTGAVVGTVTKNVDVSKAPSVTTILTAGDLGLSTKTVGDFLITAVIKHTDPTTGDVTSVAKVQFVVGRRIGDAGYTAVEYLPGFDWINGSFSAVDADMTYVGIQHYDWRATIAPSKSEATVDVAVTVVNEKGETVATLNKTGVVCAKGATTALVTAGEIAELTADLYGKFAITTVASMGGKEYVGIYGVIEHVEGEFVADTVAPEFAPANWENCGLPTAVTVTNNGEMNKPIEVKISITDAQGTVLASMNKTATVGAGASGELVTKNQLRQFITVRGATYYVVIEGRWSNGYDEYTINETLTYVWTEHTDTEVVPGFAATCTATGLTDGVFCNGCNGTIDEQEEIPVDPEAHNFVDGSCACGATQEPEIVPIKMIQASQVIMGNNMDMMFAIIKNKVSDWTGYYAEIVHVYADGRPDDVQTVSSEDFGTSGSYYTVTYKGLAAKEMCDKLTVTIYNEKGQAVSIPHVDSLEEYARRNYNVTSGLSAAKLAAKRTMIVDMLNYGAAAQIKAGYGDILANAKLTAEQQAMATQDVTLTNDVNNTHPASQLMLESNISFWIAFKDLNETMRATIEYTDYLGKSKIEYIEGKDFGTSGSFKYIASTQVVMADAYQKLNITIYNADGSVHTTTQDSIQAYLARSYEKQSEANKPLYTAIMKFATSARTYLLFTE